MADIEPLLALHYDLSRTGGLQPVVAPPYDVIDAAERARLQSQSPYNVVGIDLPQGEPDPYAHAAELLTQWRESGIVTADETPAIWALEQDYTGPDGRERTRRGYLARVRIEEYGSGRIRPHERTHPGPKEDRLRLTRATRANLSPIFALLSDPDAAAWTALSAHRDAEPWGTSQDPDGTVNRLWRIADPTAIEQVQAAAKGAELLIADGHHRYETARVYAEEIGGDGPHRYVLMCLVALEDPGLTVFPTHRLVRGLDDTQRAALAEALERDWESQELPSSVELAPPATAPDDTDTDTDTDSALRIGFYDGSERIPRRLTLKDPEIADAALPDRAEPYRRLDTAVLEALVLKGALNMSDEQIDHLDGLGYARDDAQALALVERGDYDAAFFMAPTPIARVQAVAATGESMPPKSTYFFPKVPTGLLFNPLV